MVMPFLPGNFLQGFSSFKPVFTKRFFSLEEAVANRVGSNESYYRLSGVDSVISCVLDQEDQFVMVRQYRPNLEIYTVESPAGGVEAGESPLAAMQREISEETGLRCPLLPVGNSFRLMMNRTNIKDYLFFGMFPEKTPGFTGEPGIEVLRIPRSELLQMTLGGGYLQLGALGLLQLVGGILNVDMWRSQYVEIVMAFSQHPDVIYQSPLNK